MLLFAPQIQGNQCQHYCQVSPCPESHWWVIEWSTRKVKKCSNMSQHGVCVRVCLWLLLFLLFLIKQHNIYFTPYAHSLNDRQLKPEKALTQTKVDNNQQQAVRAAETNVSQYPMFQKQLEIKRMVDSFGVGILWNYINRFTIQCFHSIRIDKTHKIWNGSFRLVTLIITVKLSWNIEWKNFSLKHRSI